MDTLEISREILINLEKGRRGVTAEMSLSEIFELFFGKADAADVFGVLSTQMRMELIKVKYNSNCVALAITQKGKQFLDGLRDETRFALLKDIREKMSKLINYKG